MNKNKGFSTKGGEKMKTAIVTKEANPVISVEKSAILADIQKEVSENMRLCTCDDYEVCAYENS